MATDKRGRKLPRGIYYRSGSYESRPSINNKRYFVRGATIGDVQKQIAELKYKVEHGLFVEKKKITFDEWFSIWVEEYKTGRVKSGTINTYRKYYERAIKGRIGKIYISEIRGEHIQKMYNQMEKEGYAVTTIKVISAVMCGCFKQALKNGLIERNPIECATLPREKERKTHMAMTRIQQALFMEIAKGSYLYNLFSVMLRTGMRSGEIRGLRYSDIDKKKGVIHIRRTLKYQEGKGYYTDTPKIRTSRRDIPLTAETLKFLENQKNFWGFKVTPITNERFLFCNEDGEPLSRERIQSEIDRITKRINSQETIEKFPRITSHVFRHTFATRAIEAGMQPQVLKTILGNSSLSMTMDLYSHVLDETRTEEMEKIEIAF